MEITKTVFKEYEYGWYGFACSYNGMFMAQANSSYRKHDAYKVGYRSDYFFNREQLLKQIPRLKGVVFIYGDYKTSV
jgi:hypothetical protein